ncbi:hypothetical protein ZOSMA_7G00340 [Zostera marina]|uniref:Uncharacterized protein n=1 Tax=Zostera marina TaxID=29655 RepID=A0A0K9NMM4_ZOSMR|nr:hypothetical protein ZOSMA_7G00340 [Zostera marina]
MALTNFILTVAGVSAAVVLLRYDVKKSAAVFRRNARQIKHWLEEDPKSAAKNVNELESKISKKDVSKDDKH